jgi:hypothetical protein
MCKKHYSNYLYHLDPSKQAARSARYLEKEKAKSPTKSALKAREYRNRNKEKVLLREREYAARNRARLNERAKRRARTLGGRWVHLKTKAKKRNLAVTLSKEQYSQLILHACFYCSKSLPVAGIGLDRLDNNRGYEIDNVVPCCTVCNRMRGDQLTPFETYLAIQMILFFRAHETNND